MRVRRGLHEALRHAVAALVRSQVPAAAAAARYRNQLAHDGGALQWRAPRRGTAHFFA